DAEKKIELEIGDVATDRELTFVCNENSKKVMLSELGLKVDSKKIAESAYQVGRSGGVFDKAKAFFAAPFGKNEIPVFVAVNDKALESLLGEVAEEFETPVAETGYELEGNTLTVIKGSGGQMVDREKVLLLLGEAVQDASISEIELVVEKMQPKEVDLNRFYAELTEPARDAEYTIEDGEIVIIPEKPCITVDKNEIKKALDSDKKTYSLSVQVEYPEKTAEILEELLFRDVLGSYSSGFASSSAARASNVILTAQRVNGVVLMPGDVFSYDGTVGRRTAANGYKEAGVYIGNKVESGIGGGICQTSSTLYSAALYANLEIVQRTSHSLPVAYVPAGMDATIAEGYIDLKLKNNTDYPVKLVALVNGRTLTCKILGVKTEGQTVEVVNYKTADFEPQVEIIENENIPKGYKKTVAKGAPGYSYGSKRIVKMNGETVKEEKLTNSVYRASNTEIEVNPFDKETPIENLREYNEEEYKKEQEQPKEDVTVENIEEPDVEDVVAEEKPKDSIDASTETEIQSENFSSEE
ncbi:MAG: VanW family protein, partial [Clostridia bacterium]|nr:VanW family protein [Clostridia bacterium]